MTLGDDRSHPLPLRAGARGAAVRDLEQRLAGAGFVAAGDPGCYDAETEAAVRRFQEARGLHTDGVCGRQTWETLVEAGYQLGDRLLYHRRPMLRGDDIADLQRQLCALGFDTGRVDGIFGPDTEQAVRDFQRNGALTTDGVCGRDTTAALARLGTRTHGEASVAQIRQTEELLTGAGTRRRSLAIGHQGGLDALVHVTARHARAVDATVLVLNHPDEHEHARLANEAGVDAYLGLDAGEGDGAEVAYFAVPGFTSVGGQRLAELIGEDLGAAGWSPVAARGMRLPVLRETRMPAVRCTMGPASLVVARLDELATGLSRGLERWLQTPVAPPAEG